MARFCLVAFFVFMSQVVWGANEECASTFSSFKVEELPYRKIYSGTSQVIPGIQQTVKPILELLQSTLSGRSTGKFELYSPNGTRWFLEASGENRVVVMQYTPSAKKAGTRIKTENRLNEPLAYFEFSMDSAQVAHSGNHAQLFTSVRGEVGPIHFEGYEQVGDLSKGAPQIIMRSFLKLGDTVTHPHTGKQVTLARLLGIRLNRDNADLRILALGERVVVRSEGGAAIPTLDTKLSLFVAKPVKE